MLPPAGARSPSTRARIGLQYGARRARRATRWRSTAATRWNGCASGCNLAGGKGLLAVAEEVATRTGRPLGDVMRVLVEVAARRTSARRSRAGRRSCRKRTRKGLGNATRPRDTARDTQEGLVNAPDLKEKLDRIRAEVGRALIGQEEVVDHTLHGRSWRAATCCSRARPASARRCSCARSARVLGCESKRIQFTPDLMPSDVTGGNVFNQQRGGFEFLRGPRVHPAAARRRDQPRARQDPVVAARGDAGTQRHHRRHDPPAARSVLRHRHAEPDRIAGHLPAARGAARSLPVQAGRAAPDHRQREGDPRQPPGRASTPAPSTGWASTA